MWAEVWTIVVGLLGLGAGYVLGRRAEADVWRERAERRARVLAEEAATVRRPGLPTNRSGVPSEVRPSKWRMG